MILPCCDCEEPVDTDYITPCENCSEPVCIECSAFHSDTCFKEDEDGDA